MDRNALDQLQNSTVFATDGDKIGSVGQVYLDDVTNEPTFVTVKTGLFGARETFVPLQQARTKNPRNHADHTEILGEVWELGIWGADG